MALWLLPNLSFLEGKSLVHQIPPPHNQEFLNDFINNVLCGNQNKAGKPLASKIQPTAALSSAAKTVSKADTERDGDQPRPPGGMRPD